MDVVIKKYLITAVGIKKSLSILNVVDKTGALI